MYLTVCYQLERESKVLNLAPSISSSWSLHGHQGTQLSHRETGLDSRHLMVQMYTQIMSQYIILWPETRQSS